jgi:hypothetical protein
MNMTEGYDGRYFVGVDPGEDDGLRKVTEEKKEAPTFDVWVERLKAVTHLESGAKTPKDAAIHHCCKNGNARYVVYLPDGGKRVFKVTIVHVSVEELDPTTFLSLGGNGVATAPEGEQP